MARTKVVIINGGGKFGVIPIYFLKEAGVTDIREYVDVLGGTSIGGICALYLAQGKSAKDLHVDFNEACPDIFKSCWWRNFNFNCSKYPAQNIEPFLKSTLVGQLGDLQDIKVIIPTMSFGKAKPKIFDNIIEDKDLEMCLWEIARATSAAPTYFPPYSEDILIDGGLLENSPVVTTCTAIHSKMDIAYKDMDVLVLGTGYEETKHYTLKEVERFNKIDWLSKCILPWITKSNEMASHFYGQNMDLGSYTYYNPIKVSGEMDDTSNIVDHSLEKLCEPKAKEFKEIWKKFIK